MAYTLLSSAIILSVVVVIIRITSGHFECASTIIRTYQEMHWQSQCVGIVIGMLAKSMDGEL